MADTPLTEPTVLIAIASPEHVAFAIEAARVGGLAPFWTQICYSHEALRRALHEAQAARDAAIDQVNAIRNAEWQMEHDARTLAEAERDKMSHALSHLSDSLAEAEADRARVAADMERLTSLVRDVIDHSVSAPPGGQQVGPPKYNMTIGTRKALQWAVDNYGLPRNP